MPVKEKPYPVQRRAEKALAHRLYYHELIKLGIKTAHGDVNNLWQDDDAKGTYIKS